MNIGFPFTVGADGRTHTVDRASHIHEMIEVTLFTEPGERVNRPDFGCGVQQMVFGDLTDAMTTASAEVVRAALQHSMRELIEVHSVDLRLEESTLRVDIGFTDRATGNAATARIARQT